MVSGRGKKYLTLITVWIWGGSGFSWKLDFTVNLPVTAQKMTDIFIRCREVRPHAGKVNVNFTLEEATKA